MMLRSRRATLALAVGLLLLFWLTRIMALTSFPPFVDEGVHLAFGEHVLTQGPLAHASEGRQFTVWLYVAAQAQAGSAGLFAARAATVLAVLPGVAAAMAAARLLGGGWSATLAALLFTFSAFHLFFDRLALADPISASAVLVSVYFAARLHRRAHWHDAALCGAALFLAAGAKLSALPYLAVPVLAALTLKPTHRSWAQNIRWAFIALVSGGGLISLYFGVVFLRGSNPLFHLVNPGSTGQGSPAANLEMAVSTLAHYAGPVMAALLAGVGVLLARRRFFLPLVLLVPLLPLLISSRSESRYFLPPFSLLLLCGAVAVESISTRHAPVVRRLALAGVLVWAAVSGLPFLAALTTEPVTLALSDRDRGEYITAEGSGFGFAEVSEVLRAEEAGRVIGVLANCASLRYLAPDLAIECPRLNPNGEDVPALEAMLEANRQPGVYAVLEAIPYAPASAPGVLVAEIEGAPGRPLLRVYALGE